MANHAWHDLRVPQPSWRPHGSSLSTIPKRPRAQIAKLQGELEAVRDAAEREAEAGAPTRGSSVILHCDALLP